MNKLVTCAGLAAVGVASLQAQYLGDGPQKAWNVSARLRGFYDDNYATMPSHRTDGGVTERGSWGTRAGVEANYNPKLSEMTTLGLKVGYDMYYYEDRPRGAVDHTLQAGVSLSHTFSERFKLDLSDNFVVGQEPDLLEPGVQATHLRSEGSNIRNTAAANLTAGLTQKLSSQVGYRNTLYNYEHSGDASRSALLDRMEQLASIDFRWQFSNPTTGLVGYQLGLVDYSSGHRLMPLGFLNPGFTALNGGVAPTAAQQTALDALIPTSRSRDNLSHYFFVGADHNFTTKLTSKLRVGAQYTEYPNATQFTKKSSVVPYLDASVNYGYGAGSQLQLGVKHMRNQTDVATSQVVSVGPPIVVLSPTMDQESTTVYASVTQKLASKLSLTGRVQWQDSEFSQGVANGVYDNVYVFDLNLSYEVNKFIFAEAGYGYDRLDSDLLNRGFSRNRLYMGVRATY